MSRSILFALALCGLLNSIPLTAARAADDCHQRDANGICLDNVAAPTTGIYDQSTGARGDELDRKTSVSWDATNHAAAKKVFGAVNVTKEETFIYSNGYCRQVDARKLLGTAGAGQSINIGLRTADEFLSAGNNSGIDLVKCCIPVSQVSICGKDKATGQTTPMLVGDKITVPSGHNRKVTLTCLGNVGGNYAGAKTIDTSWNRAVSGQCNASDPEPPTRPCWRDNDKNPNCNGGNNDDQAAHSCPSGKYWDGHRCVKEKNSGNAAGNRDHDSSGGGNL